MIHAERIRKRRPGSPNPEGKWVLYWMQQSQRRLYNHALAHACDLANRLNLPVLTVFGLTDDYPAAGRSQYRFMLEGLCECSAGLLADGIGFVVRMGSPSDIALEFAQDSACIVMDRGYLRHQREWRDQVVDHSPCPVIEVESDVVIPVETVSEKEEYAAAYLRRKIQRQLDTFLVPLDAPGPAVRWEGDLPAGEDLSDPDAVLASLNLRGPSQDLLCRGGEAAAAERLQSFLAEDLARYKDDRNDPGLDCSSHLSPYLHFGQISALDIALQVRECQVSESTEEAFLEELIVRRELSMNFVHYNPDYDRYDALPDWCLRTLGEHRQDERPYVYSAGQLENADTHDPYWNAAQAHLVRHGRIHNYMRMYWGKKILEWSETPEEAFEVALDLNNRYELDGRDPNGYAGVAWCFGKHDRPWQERDIFGKVRYMNDRGLERKFDMQVYLDRVKSSR